MPCTPTITISESDPETIFVHRFRNLGEDVFRALRDVCEIDIREIDRATTSFVLRGIEEAGISAVRERVETELEAHFFLDSAELTAN